MDAQEYHLRRSPTFLKPRTIRRSKSLAKTSRVELELEHSPSGTKKVIDTVDGSKASDRVKGQ